MKKVIALLFVISLAFSCSRKQTADISGILLFSCDNPTPMIGTEVNFSSSGGSDILSAVVDSTGYFEISGKYTPASGYNFKPYRLYVENGATFAPTELVGHFPPDSKLDTLYFDHKVKVILKVVIDSALVLTSQDTLRFDSPYFDDFRNKRYPGPFQIYQVIDTFEVSIDPHTEFPTNDNNGYWALHCYRNDLKDTSMVIPSLTGQRINYCGKFLTYEYHIK